jgi:hypothetical protein
VQQGSAQGQQHQHALAQGYSGHRLGCLDIDEAAVQSLVRPLLSCWVTRRCTLGGKDELPDETMMCHLQATEEIQTYPDGIRRPWAKLVGHGHGRSILQDPENSSPAAQKTFHVKQLLHK